MQLHITVRDASSCTTHKGAETPSLNNVPTFKSQMRLNDKINFCLLDPVCQVMKLLNRKGKTKVRHRHWIAIDSICRCTGIVALDLMANNLMAKEIVVYPSSSTSAFSTT